MLETLQFAAATTVAFIITISVIVFVHEFGHYIVAKWCRVRIEAFSIGFGRELFGWTDKSGTRWKFAVLPLGGYVKMFGDADPASSPDPDAIANMREEERDVAFHYKPLWQKAAIVFAGPLFNFLLAIVLFAIVNMTLGQIASPPRVDSVLEDSVAAVAGILPDDEILEIKGIEIHLFEELQDIVARHPEVEMELRIRRAGEERRITLAPERYVPEDEHGEPLRNKRDEVIEIGRLGISAKRVPLPLSDALLEGASQTWWTLRANLRLFKEVGTGERSTEAIGSVPRIWYVVGLISAQSITWLIEIAAKISIALGLINLFPIPMLDGGHLLFYGIEATRGKPLGERAQEYLLRGGFAILITFMIFAIFNDFFHLGIIG